MVKVPPLAVPQLGSCASSGRAWRLWAARHSQEEAGPLGARPLPSVLEPAASEAAHFTAFDHDHAGAAVQRCFALVISAYAAALWAYHLASPPGLDRQARAGVVLMSAAVLVAWV